MTTEEYSSMKKGYLELIVKIMTESGGLAPSITVLGIHKDDGKNAIVHVPIASKYMQDEDSKDEFVNEIVPEIANHVRDKFDINAVAWASEAWLRVADAKTTTKDELLGNWKNLPIKKEVLIITIESQDQTETTIKEIVRRGKQVNEDGELTDNIELIDLPEYSDGVTGEGRFAGLYKKFTQNL
jgi:hypothetical protein